MWPTNYVRKSGLITVANMEGVNSLKNRSVLKECERRTELRALVGTIYVPVNSTAGNCLNCLSFLGS